MTCMSGFPSFGPGEVELLVSAVRKAVEHLRDANERLGGKDRQMLETGQRYAAILEKLEQVEQQYRGSAEKRARSGS
jgi:hypothetical protein